MSKATDALDQAILYGYVTTDRLRKPGQVVMKQSRDNRAALQELKPEEIANIRDDIAAHIPKEDQQTYLRYQRRKKGK